MKFLFWLFFFSFSTSFILVKVYKGYMESEWAYVDQVKSMGYLNQTVCKQDLIQKAVALPRSVKKVLLGIVKKL